MRRWLFVIGPARHGTSLVQWLLDLHADCICMKDSHIVRAMSYVYQPPEIGAEADRIAFGNHATIAEGAQMRWRAWAPPLVLPRYMSKDDFVRETCEGVRRAAGDPLLFGDKAPAYCYMWETILRLWPEAAIVRCTREFSAALGSWVRTPFINASVSGPEREAVCRRQMAAARAAVSDCPCVRQVELERLEADPEGEIAALIEAVGLSLDGYDMSRAVQQVVAPVARADMT